MCIGQVDFAFDHMPQVSSFASKDHFDLEFSLSRQLFLTHHPFNGLLRCDPHLLEIFSHRNINCSMCEPRSLQRGLTLFNSTHVTVPVLNVTSIGLLMRHRGCFLSNAEWRGPSLV